MGPLQLNGAAVSAASDLRVSVANQRSTWLSQEADVGVE